MGGQVKSVKPCLKQLQQSIQTIMGTDDGILYICVLLKMFLLLLNFLVFTGSNQADMFLWMPKEHLYVLVYLVTVMHSMQAGYMEKAQKYTDKALMQIEKLQSELQIHLRDMTKKETNVFSF